MEINSEAIKNEINSMDQVFLSVLRESIVHTKQKGRGSIYPVMPVAFCISSGKPVSHFVTVSSLLLPPASQS